MKITRAPRVGDLVNLLWCNNRMNYTEAPLLVLENAGGAVKVLYPDGQIKSGIKEWYEVISES
jgi:hypothetical protein